MIVADTNLIAYFLIQGECTEAAVSIFNEDSDWIAPYLWRSEFSNILSLYLRQNLITLFEAKNLMSEAKLLMKDNEHKTDFDLVLETAMATGLSSYDSEYVALAVAKELLLVTNDKKILKVQPKIAVSLNNYEQS